MTKEYIKVTTLSKKKKKRREKSRLNSAQFIIQPLPDKSACRFAEENFFVAD